MTVYPGPVDTELARKGYAAYDTSLLLRMSPQGTTEELARLVRRGVERRRSRIVYPRMYAVALWFPGIARWLTARFSPPVKRLAAKT